MKKITYRFSNQSVDYYLAGGFSHLKEITDSKYTVLVTDENVYQHHQKRFKKWNTIVLKPGEEFKVQATVDSIIEQLIEMEVDRKATLVGVGGGVVTDITGYVASTYMRGIRFGFVPTTLLAMVDASIGGKNGIDVGVYKNLVGTIRQPSFILHDLIFLNTLSKPEWENGFAEIIKHACILDVSMFGELENFSFTKYRNTKKLICDLIQRNTILKTKVVMEDEYESGNRKLLNFGHTLGHALENQYDLSHGQAISIGMTYACEISHMLNGFNEAERVTRLLAKYNLPTHADFNKSRVIDVLKLDKKRQRKEISYVLLKKIGKAVIKNIPLKLLEKIIIKL